MISTSNEDNSNSTSRLVQPSNFSQQFNATNANYTETFSLNATIFTNPKPDPGTTTDRNNDYVGSYDRSHHELCQSIDNHFMISDNTGNTNFESIIFIKREGKLTIIVTRKHIRNYC